MKRALVSLLTLALVIFVTVQATSSFFSDLETSTGNSFEAGALDLKVNDTDNPGNLVTVPDLKPGDNYDFEKKLRVMDNNAKVWLMLSDLVATQGAQLEPEVEEENGVPKSDLHNYLLYDLSINDQIILSLDDEISIASASGCWIPLGSLPGNQEISVTQSFHLPSEVSNWAQGDQLTFTENFFAVQTRNINALKPPEANKIWDPGTKSCQTKVSYVVSDSTWRTSDIFDPNWLGENYDDSGWDLAKAPSGGTCGPEQIGPLPSLNGAVPMSSQNPTTFGTSYFRKKFELQHPSNGVYRIWLDDDGEVYVNGNLVLSDYDGTVVGLHSGDISTFLHEGENVIEIKLIDTTPICTHVLFELTLMPQTISFEDNFNDNIFDNWEIIGSKKVPTDFGNWRIINGELFENAGGDGYMAFADNFNLSDLTVDTKAKFVDPAGYGGFVIWFQDHDNFVFVRVYPGAGGIWVEEWISGVSTLTSYPYYINYHDNLWYDLKAKVDSSNGDLFFYINNVEIFTHHLSTSNRSGRIGLMDGNSGTYFDDFSLIQN